jgi:hypothetical protein
MTMVDSALDAVAPLDRGRSAEDHAVGAPMRVQARFAIAASAPWACRSTLEAPLHPVLLEGGGEAVDLAVEIQ